MSATVAPTDPGPEPATDLTIRRDDRVGESTIVTHVTEFYCPPCQTALIARSDSDYAAFLDEHFGCEPASSAPRSRSSADTPRRTKRLAARAVPDALVRLGRAATLNEITHEARRYAKGTVLAALRASPQVVHACPGLWIAASCTGVPADDLRRLVVILDDCSDSDGLIDESRLEARCSGEPWADQVEQLAAALGCGRVLGLLCRRDTHLAVAKAAMVHLGGRATPTEAALATGRSKSRIASAFSASWNILPEGDGSWALAPEGYREFVEALRAQRGYCGVVMQDELAAALGYSRWCEQLEALAVKAGCERLFGRLLSDLRPVTLACWTLAEIGRPASGKEIAGALNAEVAAPYRLTGWAVNSTCRWYWELFERHDGARWWFTSDALREVKAVMEPLSPRPTVAARLRSGLARSGEALLERVTRGRGTPM